MKMKIKIKMKMKMVMGASIDCAKLVSWRCPPTLLHYQSNMEAKIS